MTGMSGVKPTLATVCMAISEMNDAVIELKKSVIGYNGTPGMASTVQNHDVAIKEMKEEVKEQKKIIKELEDLKLPMKILLWFCALIGASVFALIWSVIIGQAQIVFK
jgi:hypothetical protein